MERHRIAQRLLGRPLDAMREALALVDDVMPANGHPDLDGEQFVVGEPAPRRVTLLHPRREVDPSQSSRQRQQVAPHAQRRGHVVDHVAELVQRLSHQPTYPIGRQSLSRGVDRQYPAQLRQGVGVAQVLDERIAHLTQPVLHLDLAGERHLLALMEALCEIGLVEPHAREDARPIGDRHLDDRQSGPGTLHDDLVHGSDGRGFAADRQRPERSRCRQVEVSGGIVAQEVLDGQYAELPERLGFGGVHKSHRRHGFGPRRRPGHSRAHTMTRSDRVSQGARSRRRRTWAPRACLSRSRCRRSW